VETKLAVDGSQLGTRADARLESFVVAPGGDGGICGIFKRRRRHQSIPSHLPACGRMHVSIVLSVPSFSVKDDSEDPEGMHRCDLELLPSRSALCRHTSTVPFQSPQASHPGGVRRQGDAGPHRSATDRGMVSSPTTLCHVSRSVNGYRYIICAQ
jgi:hypothetical protein